MIGGLTLLSLQLISVSDTAAPTVAPAEARPASAQIREEDLILLAVTFENMTLTETLTSYGDPSDPLLPIGALAQLLSLDITVSPPEQRITGRIGESSRSLIVDLPAGLARVGGQQVTLHSQDVAITVTEIFIRASAIERLLPLKLKVEPESLTVEITATEKLPIQLRLEREGRLQGLRGDPGQADPVLRVESPYRLFSPPAFDVALQSGRDSQTRRTPRRYDLRAAGDLLYAGFNGYLGSNELGSPSSARLQFERRSPQGELLGPLKATHIAAGDVFTPTLALGPRSIGGRGVTFTTAKLEQASVFQRISLRGELPIGYDVELYINDVLRSGQRSPVEGRYEFLDVPLTRGLNVIRIVTYGPHGERAEQTQVLNVGGGQLPKGKTSVEFGLVQQDRPLIQVQADESVATSAAYGDLRATLNFAYGIREDLTFVAGGSFYSVSLGDRRRLLTIGARSSVFGLAVQADGATDLAGGRATAVGFAGQPFGVSMVARHVEYAGGFIDETNRLLDLSRPLSRHSEVTLDFSMPPIGGKIIPLSFRAERMAFAQGRVTWTALGRASATMADMLVSTGLDYHRDEPTASPTTPTDRLTGNLAVSRFLNYKWQLRGVLDYDLMPRKTLRSLSITADRNVSERLAVRLAAGKRFAQARDVSVQAAAFLRLPVGEFALTGDYAALDNAWRIGIRFGFGLAYDPGVRRYRMTRPGPAGSASASFHAFTDRNGNGAFDPGEDPVKGVRIEGTDRAISTDEHGRAFVTGLGNSVTGQIKANIEGSDAFFVNSPPQNIEFSPRAGDVLNIDYPLAPVSEVMATVKVWRKDGSLVGVSGVKVRLVKQGKDEAQITGLMTEFDGTVVFSNIAPGTYRLELDPQQAARLKMRLTAPVTVTVEENGNMPDVSAEVEF